MKVFLLKLVLLVALVAPGAAQGHFKPGKHNAEHAINWAFCGKNNRKCRLGQQAKKVAWCESKWYVWARNGQYWGMFQMGEWARSRFGHGIDPWSQAKAAYRYYRVSGWSGWQCTPWGYLRW